MARLPCIMCGKEVNAMFGSNTIYNSKDQRLYACHNGRCDGGKGAYDTSVIVAHMNAMSQDDLRKSLVPLDETNW